MEKTLDIVDIGYNCEGVAKSDGAVFFVPYALVGEKMVALTTQAKSQFVNATLKQVITPSPHRIVPPCPYYGVCGGCQLQHATYEHGLELKTKAVQTTLTRVGKLNVTVLPCVASPKQFGYRNKMVFQVGQKLGMFEEGSHQVVAVENCLLGGEHTQKIIQIFNEYIAQNHITYYNEKTGKGLLRYVMARQVKNSFLFVVVANGKSLPNVSFLTQKLAAHFDDFGLFLNVNTQAQGEILSPHFVHLYGKKTLTDQENGIVYEIGPYSFLQVNQQVKQKIYDAVLEQIDGKVVVDAYSGAGLLSAVMSKKATWVYAIEINKEATAMAELLKQKNNIQNLTNLNGDCKDLLPSVTAPLASYTLVLDPPRAGCHPTVMEVAKQSKPQKIVYISCNPSTLARDLAFLMQDYQIDFVQPYDMFAQTKHVETLVCLIRIP